MRVVAGLLAIVAVLWTCASCTETKPPPQPHTQHKFQTEWLPGGQPSQAQRQQERQGAAAAAAPSRQESRQPQERDPANASAAAAATAGGMPAPPKGAQYTIFCTRIQSPGHVELATRVKGELAQQTGLNGWYVVHEDGQSLLYYGFYKTFRGEEDAREAARAQADLRRVKSISSANGPLFANALFVHLESPDPEAPREWNLANVPGAWSVQIAAYKDSPLRKQAAVDAVREARKQGIEAYYYHGDTVSSVCIGVWPDEAVVVHDSASQVTPHDEKVLITPPGMPAVEGVAREKDVKVVQERVEVVDPSLKRVMAQYPTHAINGEVMVRRVRGKDIPEPSLLIRIPKEEPIGGGLVGGTPGRQQDPTMPAFEQPRLPPDPSQSIGAAAESPPPAPARREPPRQPPPAGMGRLKSIDG